MPVPVIVPMSVIVTSTIAATLLLKVASGLLAPHHVDQLGFVAAEELDVARAHLVAVPLQRSSGVFVRAELHVGLACHPPVGILADEDAAIEHTHARLLEEGYDLALRGPKWQPAHADDSRALEVVFIRGGS